MTTAVDCSKMMLGQQHSSRSVKGRGLSKICRDFSGLSLDTNLPMSSIGPTSPLDLKPDTSLLPTSGAFSPGTGAGPTSPR